MPNLPTKVSSEMKIKINSTCQQSSIFTPFGSCQVLDSPAWQLSHFCLLSVVFYLVSPARQLSPYFVLVEITEEDTFGGKL